MSRLHKRVRWRRLRQFLWRKAKQRWTHAAGAAQRRTRNKAAGLCEVSGCGEKAVTILHCEKHRELVKEACRRYRRNLANLRDARQAEAWREHWESPEGRAELEAADASAERANWPGESDPV